MKLEYAAFFDLDGTLTPLRSSWQLLHSAFGTQRQAAMNRKLAMSNEISYVEWARRDARLWRGIRVQRAIDVLGDVVLPSQSIHLVSSLADLGFYCVLITSAPSLLAERIARELRLDGQVSNVLRRAEGRLTGEVTVRVTDRNKSMWVSRFLKQLNVPRRRSIAFGDSRYDVTLLKSCAFPVAVEPNDEQILSIAKLVLERRNLARAIPSVRAWQSLQPRRSRS